MLLLWRGACTLVFDRLPVLWGGGTGGGPGAQWMFPVRIPSRPGAYSVKLAPQSLEIEPEEGAAL